MPSTHLTADEKKAVALSAELWDTLCKVVDDGPSRDTDLFELAHHIHGIQHAVMANAAARAYPELYRNLGGDPVSHNEKQRQRIEAFDR